jgi:hypothetical protein
MIDFFKNDCFVCNTTITSNDETFDQLPWCEEDDPAADDQSRHQRMGSTAIDVFFVCHRIGFEAI